MLQTYARKHTRPIDLLQFEFEVLSSINSSDVHRGPSDGVYIFGLFLENATWDSTERCLVDSAPGEFHSQIPIVHFIPKYKPHASAQEDTKEGD